MFARSRIPWVAAAITFLVLIDGMGAGTMFLGAASGTVFAAIARRRS